MDEQLINTKFIDLKKKNERFKEYTWKEHLKNDHYNNLLVWFGVIISGTITITGLINIEYAPGILGVVMSAFLVIQKHYNFAKKSNVWRFAHAESKLLRDLLDTSDLSQEAFEKAFDQWSQLKKSVEQQLPETTGYTEDSEKKT